MEQSSRNQSNDEYELVPREQLEYLQRELEKVKKNPFGDTDNSKDLLSSMDALNSNIKRLISILETANDEITKDYKDESHTRRLDALLEQNTKLAKGIVAIADLLREIKDLRTEGGQSGTTVQPKTSQPTFATSQNQLRVPDSMPSSMNRTIGPNNEPQNWDEKDAKNNSKDNLPPLTDIPPPPQ